MKTARIHYSKDGWIIDTPYALTAIELERAIGYHKKIQQQRINTMRGDVRTGSQMALDNLHTHTIKQNILPNEYSEHMIIGGR